MKEIITIIITINNRTIQNLINGKHDASSSEKAYDKVKRRVDVTQ